MQETRKFYILYITIPKRDQKIAVLGIEPEISRPNKNIENKNYKANLHIVTQWIYSIVYFIFKINDTS